MDWTLSRWSCDIPSVKDVVVRKGNGASKFEEKTPPSPCHLCGGFSSSFLVLVESHINSNPMKTEDNGYGSAVRVKRKVQRVFQPLS